MDVEGIYRKSGGNSQILQIREGFERSSDYDISDPDLDINAVTSTLKQYFRKLPTPLITFPVYDLLLNSVSLPQDSYSGHPPNANQNPPPQRAPAETIGLMRNAILELPPRHRDTLEFLVFHLARVVEREKDNLMTSLNVAVVFRPDRHAAGKSEERDAGKSRKEPGRPILDRELSGRLFRPK